MQAILKLLFNYWKRSYSWIFSFIFPLLTLLIFKNFTTVEALLPNFLVSTALSNGVFGLAIIYSDLKNSVIMKKIRATPLPQWKVVGGIITFNTLISFLGGIWVFFMGSLFYHSQMTFSYVNWFYLLVALLLATLTGSLIGFFLGSIAPDLRTAGNLSFFINTPSNFLAGIFVPMNILLRNETLTKIAKFFPYSYPVSIANHAFSHKNFPAIQNQLLFQTYHWPLLFSLKEITEKLASRPDLFYWPVQISKTPKMSDWYAWSFFAKEKGKDYWLIIPRDHPTTANVSFKDCQFYQITGVENIPLTTPGGERSRKIVKLKNPITIKLEN